MKSKRQARNTRRNRPVLRSDGRRFGTIAEAAEETKGARGSGIITEDFCGPGDAEALAEKLKADAADAGLIPTSSSMKQARLF